MSTSIYESSYKKMQTDTATPEQLVLMLYDGALKFVTLAEEAFKEKNITKINNYLLRVQAIFTELLTALDKEKGGEIALNLERLYIFFIDRLTEANIKKDPKPMLEIKPLIENLRNSWAEAIKIVQKNSSNQSQKSGQLQKTTPTSKINVAA